MEKKKYLLITSIYKKRKKWRSKEIMNFTSSLSMEAQYVC